MSIICAMILGSRAVVLAWRSKKLHWAALGSMKPGRMPCTWLTYLC